MFFLFQALMSNPKPRMGWDWKLQAKLGWWYFFFKTCCVRGEMRLSLSKCML